MHRFLDGLYLATGWLAALSMVGVLAMVLTAIVSRQFGVHVPGTDAYAGYLMAAAGFLALAHTLKHGDHIRVTLLVQYLGGRAHKALEVWALGAATLLAALFAWFSVRLAWLSYKLNDLSTGTDATPLWIPQVSMAVGTLILFVAFVDELALELSGRRFVPLSEEATHNE